MQDRVPLYPGRVRLTPVAGQENTYDMVRADQPSQAGTPLNKDSLLKDATAALYGLGADAVPDDVLAKIRELIQETETAVSSKAQIVFGRIQQPTVSNVTLPFEADCIFVCADAGNSASVLYTTLTQGRKYVMHYVGSEVYFQLSGNLLKITEVNGSGVSIDYIAIKV